MGKWACSTLCVFIWHSLRQDYPWNPFFAGGKKHLEVLALTCMTCPEKPRSLGKSWKLRGPREVLYARSTRASDKNFMALLVGQETDNGVSALHDSSLCLDGMGTDDGLWLSSTLRPKIQGTNTS